MYWYEESVQHAVNKRDDCSYEPKTIFYGSSTFALWDSLYEEFKPYSPLNLAFGGSTLEACVWFFDRIIAPLKDSPDAFILYAGDNDLGDGKSPEQVFGFYRQFITKLRERFNEVPFYFISVKPSLMRSNILDRIKYCNKIIEADIRENVPGGHFVNVFDSMTDENGNPAPELFQEDGLHLNNNGYAVLKEILLKDCFRPN
jgi:hypothetical protein